LTDLNYNPYENKEMTALAKEFYDIVIHIVKTYTIKSYKSSIIILSLYTYVTMHGQHTYIQNSGKFLYKNREAIVEHDTEHFYNYDYSTTSAYKLIQSTMIGDSIVQYINDSIEYNKSLSDEDRHELFELVGRALQIFCDYALIVYELHEQYVLN